MRTFRGIAVAAAAGTATIGLLAGCGSGSSDKNPGGDPPTKAPATTAAAAGGCPADGTILSYARHANGGGLPDGATVATKTCRAGWIVAKIKSPAADEATFVSKADGSHAVLGTSLCENGGAGYPAEIKALLHC
jgi:hypothetical protein